MTTTTSLESSTEILKWIRKWGQANSDAVLDACCLHYHDPLIEGLIGYKLEKNCAVVYGDPICSQENWGALTQSFHTWCEHQGFSVVYLMASPHFSEWAALSFHPISIQYGEEVFLNPQNDPRKKTGTHASLVRRKVRHAEKEGITFFEYKGEDFKIEEQMEKVGKEWLASRTGPQVYISHLHLFSHRYGKRWFYAMQEGVIVGTLVIHQLEEKNGWHFNHLMTLPNSPSGIPEFLVVHGLETVAKEGSTYASFGVAPAKSLGEIEGLSPLTASIARTGYAFCHRFFHLDGFDTFWGKFDPERRPSYLLFHTKMIGIKELIALKRALNVSLL